MSRYPSTPDIPVSQKVEDALVLFSYETQLLSACTSARHSRLLEAGTGAYSRYRARLAGVYSGNPYTMKTHSFRPISRGMGYTAGDKTIERGRLFVTWSLPFQVIM